MLQPGTEQNCGICVSCQSAQKNKNKGVTKRPRVYLKVLERSTAYSIKLDMLKDMLENQKTCGGKGLFADETKMELLYALAQNVHLPEYHHHENITPRVNSL